MTPILHVEHLSKSYKNLCAVKDLTFSVYPGDVFGFLGQNGAGKSTTLRMLLSLISPSSGSIRIFDKDLLRNRSYVLSKVGAVIEKPDLYKYLSAYQNLSLFASMSGKKIAKSKLLEQLDKVGLLSRAHSKVATYSQGMKQRLGIAVALAHDPELVILDEPTNGLDPQGIADIRNLILNLSSEGKTIIVSSHLLGEIEQIANRMLVMDNGVKLVEGEVSTLLDPTKLKVRIQTLNNSAAYDLFKSSVWSRFEVKQNEKYLDFTIDKDSMADLLAFFVHNGIGVLSAEPLHSLEAYFLNLTNKASHD